MMARVGRMLLAVVVLVALRSVALAQVSADETVTLHGLTFPSVVAGAEQQSQPEAQRFLQAWVARLTDRYL
jgi:hypothetical protein